MGTLGPRSYRFPSATSILHLCDQPIRESMRLAIATTHPVQYQVPWFRALAQVPGLDLVVLYAMIPDAEQQGVGFEVPFQWDIPLLEGYRYRQLENRARRPRLSRFFGYGFGLSLHCRLFHHC